MKVELIAHTDNATEICAISAHTCVSDEIPTLDDDKAMKSLEHAMASGHESVLEHASFTFAVSGVSRALTHQLVRHRVASYSQQSQRYVNLDGFGYVVPESIRNDEQAWDYYLWCMDRIRETYDALVHDHFIPEEDARYVLPNACETNIVITMNARELRHFFALRCCFRAQWEIRELATEMLQLCKEAEPELFKDAGPSCVQTGRCPEKRSCGRCKQ